MTIVMCHLQPEIQVIFVYVCIMLHFRRWNHHKIIYNVHVSTEGLELRLCYLIYLSTHALFHPAHSTTSQGLPAPEVMVFPQIPIQTAGGRLILQCTMSSIPFLAVSPTVELIGPGGTLLAATDRSLTAILMLDPVQTSHAGRYTCRASVMIASVSVNVSRQSRFNLTVQSMSVKS